MWVDTGGTGPRVLVNVSAGTRERLWPNDRYVAVMRHLRERDSSVRIRVIAAPDELERAGEIAAQGGGVVTPTPALRDAFALVASADFVLTPDTSITHAASAFHRPSVAIYVAGKSDEWGLYDTIGRNVEHPEPTMTNLAAARVIDAVDAVWDEGLVSRRG